MGPEMSVFKRAIILAILVLQSSCNRGLIAKNPCATPLSYQTNVLASGDDALKYLSIYRAPIIVGENNFKVSAIVDTGSANLIINERDYYYSLSTTSGNTPFIYENGIDKTYAINAKDQMDLACTTDLSTSFALTSKNVDTDSYLGLGFKDPKRRRHEGLSTPFFDQLVKEHDYQNVFSLALCGSSSSSRLVLGGVDPDMVGFIGNYVPIIEKTAYTVPALSIRRSDNKKVVAEFNLYDPNDKTGDRVVIDSSSPFLMLPSTMATAMVNEIQTDVESLGLANRFPEGFFRTERSSSIKTMRFANQTQIKQLPSFEINLMGLDGKAKSLEISPFNYLKEVDTKNPLFRALAIRDAATDTILGQPFLESQYTYFDRTNQLVGFANIDIACAK